MTSQEQNPDLLMLKLMTSNKMRRKSSTGNIPTRHVTVSRPALSPSEWDDRYHRQPKSPSSPLGFCRDAGRLACKDFNWKTYILSFLPILSWLPNYNWKSNFVNDLVAGFTVAVMHIPQGMAYGLLAGVDPVVGIYTGFFPVLLYVFLGTMPHNSMGTFAVISILCSKPIIRLSSSVEEMTPSMNVTGMNMSFAENMTTIMNGTMGDDGYGDVPQYRSIEVATAVAFCVGLIQFFMGMVRLGSITAILTDVLISAFTVGASMHVFTSQIKHILSVKVGKFIGAGRIVKIWINIISNIGSTNLVSLAVSVVSVAFLLFVSMVVGPKVKTKCMYPIPSQLVLVILGTVISTPLDLSTVHQVKVIGNISSIPTGLPAPSMPRLELIPQVFMDAIPVAIISYVIGQSLGSMFGAKHGYTVDPNQELIAQGASNIFGGFFSSLPMASSLARSLVQEDAGAKSLLTAVASSSFLLVVLLWIGPVFEPLPVCILASIILASLKGVILKMQDFKKYWERSKWDGVVWMTTFLATVLIDVDMGLMIGIFTSMMAVMVRGCIPKVVVLQQDPRGEAWLDRKLYRTSNKGAKVLEVSGPIHFLTCGYLELQLTREMEKTVGDQEMPNNLEGCDNVAYVTSREEVAIKNLQGKDGSGELSEIIETRGETPEILRDSKYKREDSGIDDDSSVSIKYIDNEEDYAIDGDLDRSRKSSSNSNHSTDTSNKSHNISIYQNSLKQDKYSGDDIDEEKHRNSNFQNNCILNASNLDKDIYQIEMKRKQSLKGSSEDIVLDLSQVTFIDMAGAKSIQRITEQVVREGGRVAVSGMGPRVKVALDKANVLDKIGMVYPTYRDAVQFW